MTTTGKWIENKLMVKDNTYNNESLLQGLVKDLGLNEFGTNFQQKLVKTNSTTGFCYEK
jgi:hypothetical protein